MVMVPSIPQLSSSGAHRRLPLVTLGLVLLAAVVMAGEWWWGYLPEWAQNMWLYVAAGRLYSDPDQALFALYQIWTHTLFHHGWWHLLPLVVMVGMFAGWAERMVGSWPWVGILLAVLPIVGSVHLMLAAPAPEYGLSVVLAIAVGVCVQRYPRMRIAWRCWYCTYRHVAWRTVHSSWIVPVALWIAYESVRQILHAEVSLMLVLAMPLTLLLCCSAAAVLSAAVEHMWRSSGLRAIAHGQGSLDVLEQALREDPMSDFATLERLVQRCITEKHLPAARRLATYLVLRDPQHACYKRLRSFLDDHDGPGS